jgi:hypothetical protein
MPAKPIESGSQLGLRAQEHSLELVGDVVPQPRRGPRSRRPDRNRGGRREVIISIIIIIARAVTSSAPIIVVTVPTCAVPSVRPAFSATIAHNVAYCFGATRGELNASPGLPF